MIDTFLQLLFPDRCAGCKMPGTALCDECASTVAPSSTIYSMHNAFALYDYDHPIVRKAIWQLKYKRQTPLAKNLVGRAMPRLIKMLGQQNVILVPIPQHYTKTFSRGFNQSALLAKWLQPLLQHAVVSPILKKIRATESQAQSYSRKERRKNVRNTIVAKTQIDPEKVYVLVDDVITTGSTVNEASRAIRAAGAKYVYIVALAHTPVKY